MKSIFLATQSLLLSLEEASEDLRGVQDRVCLTNDDSRLLEQKRRPTKCNFGSEIIAVLKGTFNIMQPFTTS